MADEYISFSVDSHLRGLELAEPELNQYKTKLLEALGERAMTRIKTYLPTQYMYLGHNGGDPYHNPVPPNAGSLSASVHWIKVTDDLVQVLEGSYRYSEWIEGIALGNSFTFAGRMERGLTPEFPGYFAFKKVAATVEADAGPLADSMLAPYLAAMNV